MGRHAGGAGRAVVRRPTPSDDVRRPVARGLAAPVTSMPLTGDQLRERLVTESLARAPRSHLSEVFATASTLCNSVVGVGILALPRAIANVGLATGIAMLLVTAAMSLLTLELLAESSRRWKAKTYAVLVRDAIGWLPSKMSASAVTINLFGLCVSADIAMGSALNDLLDDAGPRICGEVFNKSAPLIEQCLGRPPPDFLALTNRQLWIVLLGTFLALPLSLQGSYRALRPASAISTIAVTALAAVVVAFGVKRLARGEPLLCDDCPAYEAVSWSSGFLDSVSIMMFSFVTHSIAPRVLSEMKHQEPAVQTQALRLAVGYSTVLYLVVGVMGCEYWNYV